MKVEFLFALLGGGLIGFAALLMMFFNGRILGVSGILGGLFQKNVHERYWRVAFLVGIFIGGFLLWFVSLDPFGHQVQRPTWVVVLAGLFVGFGTRLGGGCTSGHGVCGISRLSVRSILATLIFMGAGILTVLISSRVWPS